MKIITNTLSICFGLALLGALAAGLYFGFQYIVALFGEMDTQVAVVTAVGACVILFSSLIIASGTRAASRQNSLRRGRWSSSFSPIRTTSSHLTSQRIFNEAQICFGMKPSLFLKVVRLTSNRFRTGLQGDSTDHGLCPRRSRWPISAFERPPPISASRPRPDGSQ